MPLTTTGKNNLIAVTSYTHAGALTDIAATPTEVSGGSYARQSITWGAAASGARGASAQITIPIPASTTVVAVGVWDALTAGTLQMFNQIGSTANGVATVATTGDLFTTIGHGLSADDRVFFTAPGGQPGPTVPAGLSANTIYFVRATGLTANAFTVATTSGGAAVDVTADGEVAWFKTVPQTFSVAGNLILPATTGLVVDVTAFG
jgi:hypothetical protein